MYQFVDLHRVAYGVELIWRVLQIAPSGYYEHRARQVDPHRRPVRGWRDAALRVAVRRVWEGSRRVYGARKVWWQLRRDGLAVARCTVERLMAAEELRGVVRGRRVRTTRPESAAERPQDLVQTKMCTIWSEPAIK